MSGKGNERRRARGFTYIGLLILIAIIAMAAAATVQLGSIYQRRAVEEELLDIGRQFRNALTSYVQAAPPGKPALPKSLDDLLRDPRQPKLVRHLRRVPLDPITGTYDWGVARTADGLIVGIHSRSDAHPIKIANFAPEFLAFAEATKYSEWVFTVAPTPQAPTQKTAPSSPSKGQAGIGTGSSTTPAPIPTTGSSR